MKTNLIKVLVASSLLVFGAFAANAQPQGGPGGDPSQFVQMRANQMKESLKLTDEQYKKVVDLFTAQMADMQKMMQNQGGQPNFDPQAMQKIREDQNTKLKAILTEEQFKTWSAEEQNHRMGGGPGGPRQ
jgi:protein CpxP